MHVDAQTISLSATLENVYHSFIQSSEKHKMTQMFDIRESVW